MRVAVPVKIPSRAKVWKLVDGIRQAFRQSRLRRLLLSYESSPGFCSHSLNESQFFWDLFV